MEANSNPIEIQNRIFRIQSLAAMPQVVWQLLEAMANERTSASDLGRILESDPALATKVLSLSNSAFYGLSQKVTTVQRAVVIIGYRELEMLALGAGLADVFDLGKVPAGFDGEALWVHCLATSWAARELAEAIRYANPGEVMIGGLLHDLGKLILATHLRPELDRVMALIEQGTPYYEAEEKVKVTHTDIGRMLARKWGLPEIHTSIIFHHHNPQESDPNYLPICLVCLANIMVKALNFGMTMAARPVDHTAVLAGAGLALEQFRSVGKKAKMQIPRLLKTWLEFQKE